jgi:hypothetical protein
MSDDATPIQNRRSGEHPVSYNELMVEVRHLRRENQESTKAITQKIDGISSDLGRGALRFEQHHARINALEIWKAEHLEEHEREAGEREKEREEARDEKRREQDAAQAAAKGGPHWVVQTVVNTLVTLLTTGLFGGIIYLVTLGSKGTP